MSEHDSVAVLLKTLDQPLAPRPEFAEALRQRLLSELPERNGHRVWRPRLTLPPRPRRRRRVLIAAVAIALIAGALAAVLLSRPGPASALDVIRRAQQQAASLPPFQATVRFDLNPDGAQSLIPKGATQTMQVSYAGPKRLRTAIIGESPRIPGARAVGSYDVVNGSRFGSYDAQHKTFLTAPLSPDVAPLGDLAWKGGYPNWEKVCRGPASRVLPDTSVAGRDARHIRCSLPSAQVWQLWIDRQTGLVLKLRGQTGGGGDSFFDSAPLTTQQGGFTITKLRYHPSFPPDTFKISRPGGAFDYQARLRAAEATVPSFRALISTRYQRGRPHLEQVWWRDNGTWRINYLTGGAPVGGPGSYVVAAHGLVRNYDASDNTYSSSTISSSANPIFQLLPMGDRHYPGDCPIVGHDRIDARPVVRRRCPGYEIWVDAATGMTLQTRSRHFELRVRGLHYNPAFPAGTFNFSKPAGSRSAEQRANDPYFKTKLRPGKPAPNWQASLLDGHPFQINDLRGKPALLLLLEDSCLNDPACNVFGPLERVAQKSKHKLAVLWVDMDGNPAEARKVVHHNHLTFPVVMDKNHTVLGSNSAAAWKLQAYPYWVLLDTHGRVIEARLRRQSLSQLRQLVDEAR